MTRWSADQEKALAAVARWHRQGSASPQVFYLAGYAGTGKSTLAKHFAGHLARVCYCAFTGKAALVMRRKGCDGASTIHSLIYCPVDDGSGATRWELDPSSEAADADLIVVDECSMVGPDLGRDLLSYGRKVLVLGDPAQLPPVDGAGFFTDREPDYFLTEIHRQAAESPIIRLATLAREGRRLAPCRYGVSGGPGCVSVIYADQVEFGRMAAADIVLVGLNKTRVARCAALRRGRGLPAEVSVGDRLVCLRNNRAKGFLNGSLWRVERLWSRSPMVSMALSSLDGSWGGSSGSSGRPFDASGSGPGDAGLATVTARVNPLFFEGREDEISERSRRWSDEFYFGDALTVHKAQGSQWDSVYLFDESATFREDGARWLYTGITRAAESLTVVLPGRSVGLRGGL